MSIYDSELPNLINGVSQQTPFLRRPSQAEAQVNAYSSPVDGLTKRKPAEWIADLYAAGTDLSNAFFHFISRDASEKYLLVIRGDSSPEIEVWNLADGSSVSVLDSDGNALVTADKAYLAATASKDSLKALTVGDTTFLLNKDDTCEMSTATTDALAPAGLVFVKTVNDGSTVTINLANTPGGSTTYTASVTPSSGQDQHDVGAALVTALNSAGANAAYTYSQEDGVIHIVKTDSSDFGLNVSSDSPDGASGIKNSVSALSDLPARAVTGFKIKINGAANDATAETYWVEYKANDDSVSSGTFYDGGWEETVAPSIEYTFDASTMPHKLVSNGVDFRLSPVTWSDRTVGDATTNADPSFIDQKIDDIFFFKNRLGFVSRENVILSKVGDFFNFWATTVIQVLDDDKIDVAVGGASNSVTFLRNAVPRENELLVFGDTTQFIVDADGPLFSPKTVRSSFVSRNEADKQVRPIQLGNSIYYTFTRGSYGGVTEYIREDDFQPFISIDVTEHVPRYISGTIQNLSGSSAMNMMIARSSGNTDSIFVYCYLDRASNRLQSSWSKYTFENHTVDHAFFDDTDLYLVISFNGSSTSLVKIDMSHGATDTGLDYKIHLDRRITQADVVSRVYDSVNDRTTVTLPYVAAGSNWAAVDSSGNEISIYSQPAGTNSIILKGDYSSSNFWIGENYTMSYTLSKPFALQATRSGGMTPMKYVKFLVYRAIVKYANTSVFSASVSATSKDTYTYNFDSRNLGTSYVDVGSAPSMHDGDYIIPIMEDSKFITLTLTNSTYLPCGLLNLVWEGRVNRR